MNTLLSAGTVLSTFACTAEECLSWIIILLNILTVFYLVFCAWFKVTKAVKVIGYVWASLLTVGTVAVVAMHTCIFTILSAVFTGLIVMAVLSVVLDKGVLADSSIENAEKPAKPMGYYVIHKTTDGKFVFVLYDNKKNAVCASQYKYNGLVDVKSAIATCRENGFFAAVENKTKTWVEYANHPKFTLFEKDGKFAFRMTLSNKEVILQSKEYVSYEKCEKALDAAKLVVKSDKVYFAEGEVLPGEDFKRAVLAKVVEVQLDKTAENIEEVAQKPEVAPAPAPAPVVTEVVATAPEASQVASETTGGVVFTEEKKTLWELYAELSAEQRGYFDKIRASAESKEKTKSGESKDAYTVYYGRDKIVRLRIRKNTVEAVFFVTDSAFKQLSSESEVKIKETPTVIKLVSEEYFRLALETVDYRYDAIIAQRKAKKNRK